MHLILASGFWDSNSLLGWSAFVGLLLTAAAVAGASARNSHNAQTLANYRDAAQSWKEKSEAQDVAIKELEARDAEKDRQLSELNGRLAMLQDMVTARPAYEQLAADFSRMAGQIDRHLSEAMTQSAEIRRELSRVYEAVQGGRGHDN
jgi:predicted  nucleic acid-binding Zn-ribbon protein